MEPTYTADDLIAAAHKAGFPGLTSRLITDWVQKGLLDKPTRNPKGRGNGSAKGTYADAQCQLFLLLLAKRETSPRFDLLLNVPIAIWNYWGEDYVPTRQALKALVTWANQNEISSKARASSGVDALVDQIAHPDSTAMALTGLRRTLLDAATGRAGFQKELSKQILNVADPHGTGRKLGLPGIPLDPEKLVGTWIMQRLAMNELRHGTVSIHQLETARDLHRESMVEYTIIQPIVAASGPVDPYNRIPANPLEFQVLVINAAKNLLAPLALVTNLGRS